MTEKLKGISGSMCAGKTDSLIEFAKREGYKKHSVLAFKPSIDNRWGSENKLVSRNKENGEQKWYPAHSVDTSIEILEIVQKHLQEQGKLNTVVIDEIQFFDEQIINVVQALLEADIQVVFGGLALDFRGEPFGPMPTLLSLSDEIEKPTAVCVYEESGKPCGDDATRTQRLINGEPAKYTDPIILIGAEQNYEPRCVKHHIVPGKPTPKLTKN